jgi:hypothetical protein
MTAVYVPLRPQRQQTPDESTIYTTPPRPCQSDNSGSLLRVFTQSLLWLSFEIFLIYALVASNTHAVSVACGSSLWNLAFFELLLSWAEGAVCNMILKPAMLYHVMRVESISDLSFSFVTSSTLALICIHATMLALGASIVVPAMENTACTAALSAASFTSTPLLGILGFFFIVFDSIALLGFTCVVIGILF